MWTSLVKIRYTELKLLCGNLCGRFRPPAIPNHIIRPVSRRAYRKSKLKIKTLYTFEIISYWIWSPIKAYMMRNNIRCLSSTLKICITTSRFFIACLRQSLTIFCVILFFFQFLYHFLSSHRNIFSWIT
jgi:hypothetical protein